MASYGSRFLAACIRDGDTAQYLKFGKLDHMFALEPGAEDLYAFVKGYVTLTGTLPSIELTEAETGEALSKETTDPKFLHEKLAQTYVQRSMKLMVAEAQKHFVDDPMKAWGILTDAVREVQHNQIAPKIHDFKHAASTAYPQMVSKWALIDQGVSWGWPYMDQQGGGIWAGDLISLVGRPGLGKTWLLLWIALYVWQKTKVPIVFVSMEMSASIVMERLTAMYTKTPMNFFATGMLPNLFSASNPKKNIKSKLEKLEASDMPPFIVVDGNLTASADDVVALVQQVKAGACFVDGAYMLTADGSRNMYDAVAINANRLKRDVATSLGVPTFCTWQFGREVSKLKKGEKPGLQHIGYSDVIGQVSTVVAGLFDEDTDNNVEKLYRRKISILKGRNGETGEFHVNWDFFLMDFSETTDTVTSASIDPKQVELKP